MSLNIATVTLNMEMYHFLGISIVGQSNSRGDGGIFIGSIMKGGAVAADGRIEPGDMLLQVNDVNFENMSNDEAVRVLREVIHQPGSVTLMVAKCWNSNAWSYFTLPKSEPVHPIDPAAWVTHTTIMTGNFLPQYDFQEDDHHLTIHSDMTAVVKAMANPKSDLDVRDRMWLKITIPNAFIGSDVVDWLYCKVEGFTDRREARKYAGKLLKAGYIRHTTNKTTFSEQCYYVFGDRCGGTRISSSKCGECQKEGGVIGGSQSEVTNHKAKALSEKQVVAGSPNKDSVLRPLPSYPGLHGNKDSNDPSARPPQSHKLSFAMSEITASCQSFRLAMENPSEYFVDVI